MGFPPLELLFDILASADYFSLMKSRLYAVLFILIPVSAAAQAPDFVSLDYMLSGGSVLVTLNGFPVLNQATDLMRLTGESPMNLHLRPTENRVVIDYSTDVPASDFVLRLFGNTEDPIAGTINVGDLLQLALSDVDPDQRVSVTFDLPEEWQDRFTEGELYAQAPVISDPDRVRDYGVRIVQLAAEGDFEALAREMLPLYAAQREIIPSAGIAEDDAVVVDSMAESWRERLEGSTVQTAESPDDLVLTSWARGRLYEISWDDGRPLIYAPSGDADVAMPVFVALVDGELKVVRSRP
jgi:hypothetical protein